MVTPTSSSRARLSIGRVVAATFGVLSRNLPTFLLLSLVFQIPSLLINLAFARWQHPEVLSSMSGVVGAVARIVYAETFALARSACPFLLYAALAYGTVADLNGKRAPFGASLKAAVSDLPILLALAVVSNLAMLIGFLLLIVPGAVMMTQWFVLAPIRTIERTGFVRTFRRSEEMTRTDFVQVFGTGLLSAIAFVPLYLGLLEVMGFGILGSVEASRSPTYLVAWSVLNMFTTLIYGTGVACVYCELRLNREGIGAGQLAAVFD